MFGEWRVVTFNVDDVISLFTLFTSLLVFIYLLYCFFISLFSSLLVSLFIYIFLFICLLPVCWCMLHSVLCV